MTLPSPDDELWAPPAHFDGFAIERSLGQGGMGTVWLACEESLDRAVAIKFISKRRVGSRARFITEARAIARLQHPNVVAIYRIGEAAGMPYIAYEYVEGTNLAQLHTPVGWHRVLSIGLAATHGLVAAHDRGVLHRDIKPANIMLARDGAVKLLDFGLAKIEKFDDADSADPRSGWTWDGGAAAPPDGEDSAVPRVVLVPASETRESATRTAAGTVLGTPLYVAPEIWSGEPASERSDVYALGLVLYELLTGSLPFAELFGQELAEQIVRAPVPSVRSAGIDMPAAFGAAVDAATAHDPNERLSSARSLLEQLDAVQLVFSGLHRPTRSGAAGIDDASSLVSASYARASSDPASLFGDVYRALFARHPELRPLFPAELSGQQAKLAAAVRLAIEGLRDPPRLVGMMVDLGARHRAYGVRPEHFVQLESALLGAIERHDPVPWNDRTRDAWKRAYEGVASAMVRGLDPTSGQ